MECVYAEQSVVKLRAKSAGEGGEQAGEIDSKVWDQEFVDDGAGGFCVGSFGRARGEVEGDKSAVGDGAGGN